MPLRDRVTVVLTGSTGTVGRALAAAFTERGCALLAVGRDPDKLATLRQAQSHPFTGPSFSTITCDLASPAQVAGTASELAARLLDERVVLVNCAAEHGPLAPAWEVSGPVWQRLLTINVVAALQLSAALLPGMVARGWGRIINISSQAGLGRVGRLNAPYALSKHMLNRYTAHLAAELAGTGVTAHALHPGEIPSAMWADIAAQASARSAADFTDWTTRTQQAPSDPRRAARTAVSLLDDDAAARANGMFLWPDEDPRTPVNLTTT